MNSFTDLQRMRQRAYQVMGNGRDGLLNLMNVVLTSRSVSSFVELSLSLLFERAWSSLYKSLERSEPPVTKLMYNCINFVTGARGGRTVAASRRPHCPAKGMVNDVERMNL